jgi:hypothetical protein
MNLNNINPRDLGVPHSKWRPNQQDALQKVYSKLENGGGTLFAELPTGSGKSAIPTALGEDQKVLVLVQTHGLLDQYQDIYGFDVVKGRQAYDCVSPQQIATFRLSHKTPTAYDCPLIKMENCSVAAKCPYLIAREKALASKRMACTYAYASMSSQVHKRTGVVVFDECHNSAGELLKNAKVEIFQQELIEKDLPAFPYRSFGKNGEGDMLDNEAKDNVIAWASKCLSSLGEQRSMLDDESDDDSKVGKRILKVVESLLAGEELFLVIGQQNGTADLWNLIETRNGPSNAVITFKPISVKKTVKKITENKELTVLMSATIGNPSFLAVELGLDGYESMTYPHPIPASSRPVYDLGVLGMTWANLQANPSLYKIQANTIARFINKLDPTWRGIVLTTSYARIDKLRKMLSEKLGDRIIIPQDKTPVNQRISQFISDPRPGIIAVDTIQGWGAGIDLRGDLARFSIIAGVPYESPTDRYSQIRQARPGGKGFAFHKAYISIPQASGRVSRGELEADGTPMLNVSAIADGSALTPMALKSYPKWYKESITRIT